MDARPRLAVRWALVALAAGVLTGCAGIRSGNGTPSGDDGGAWAPPPRPPTRSDLPTRSITRSSCTPRRPCWYVRRLEDATSARRFVAYETAQLFSRKQMTTVMAWADGASVPSGAIGPTACGIRFVLNGHVVGWANLCGLANRHMRLQFTNVSQRALSLVVKYYSEPARPRRSGASHGSTSGDSAANPAT